MSKDMLIRTEKNLREVHKNVKVILAWAYDDDRDYFDIDKLCRALAECVDELNLCTQVAEPQEVADAAANTLASVREILER